MKDKKERMTDSERREAQRAVQRSLDRRDGGGEPT